MPDLADIVRAGAANPWFYLPIAVVLGALHALEPGHSKSLMAAFIIAIRGTAGQALLLGVSAALGHTIVVWGLAALGLWLGDKLILDRAEPWLALISGLMVIALASRLLWSAHRRVASDLAREHAHHHAHGRDHAHGHENLDRDAHAKAHRREVEQRFAGRSNVTAAEIAWFGFTGGLLPCPAAIAVLLICLQLKQVGLGIAMVAAFSVGLAATMVAVGVVAAWGARRAAQSLSGFAVWADQLPYISGALVLILGVVVSLRGLWELIGRT